MQFTGHSLPVNQSMSVPWEFFASSHFISQLPPSRFPLITAIRMCHLLPVHHLGMVFLAGSKTKIQHYLMVFLWSLNESKSPQVSRTLLSILADHNNALVWIVSTRFLIFKSSSPCTNTFVIVPSASITIGITVTFMFHFFHFSCKV